MKIKTASINDLQSLNDLYFACSENMKEQFNLNHWENPYPEETLKHRLENGTVFKILSDDNEFIGSFMLETEYPEPYIKAIEPDDKPFRYLTRLAVFPQIQASGIGSWALQKAEEIAQSQGANVMRLDFLANYELLEGFYLKNGYKLIGTGHTRRFTISFMEKEI